MASKHHKPADTLEEIESAGERLLAWVGANPILVMSVAAAILLSAAGLGGYRALRHAAAVEASAALEKVRIDYTVAMGGAPGDVLVPEPANPETARAVRREFVDRFAALGLEYGGTGAGALASLDAGSLYLDLGAPDQALETWQAAAEAVAERSALRGVLLNRIAQLYEQDEKFAEAAQIYEDAAAIGDYPLRDLALGHAARTWVAAAQPERALAAYDRLQANSPDTRLPAHVAALLEELSARR